MPALTESEKAAIRAQTTAALRDIVRFARMHTPTTAAARVAIKAEAGIAEEELARRGALEPQPRARAA